MYSDIILQDPVQLIQVFDVMIISTHIGSIHSIFVVSIDRILKLTKFVPGEKLQISFIN